MKLMLGVPVGKLSVSVFCQHLFNFVMKSRIPLQIQSSNRVDLNRSAIMDTALKGGYDVLMIDSDVIINTDINTIKAYLDEDFKDRKVGAVVAPTVGVGGMLIAPAPPNKDLKVWEVDYAGMGFVVISNEVLQKLPVIAQYTSIGGQEVPMRVVYATNTSEDVMLCQAIKQLGFKILVDSRIKVTHLQTEALSYPESWDRGKHL